MNPIYELAIARYYITKLVQILERLGANPPEVFDDFNYELNYSKFDKCL